MAALSQILQRTSEALRDRWSPTVVYREDGGVEFLDASWTILDCSDDVLEAERARRLVESLLPEYTHLPDWESQPGRMQREVVDLVNRAVIRAKRLESGTMNIDEYRKWRSA